jgi:hypothetical protein
MPSDAPAPISDEDLAKMRLLLPKVADLLDAASMIVAHELPALLARLDSAEMLLRQVRDGKLDDSYWDDQIDAHFARTATPPTEGGAAGLRVEWRFTTQTCAPPTAPEAPASGTR